jgi:hypothetical protein
MMVISSYEEDKLDILFFSSMNNVNITEVQL